jgi:hypothetical protein
MPTVLETLADLVRINSINSSYEGGPGRGGGRGLCAALL